MEALALSLRHVPDTSSLCRLPMGTVQVGLFFWRCLCFLNTQGWDLLHTFTASHPSYHCPGSSSEGKKGTKAQRDVVIEEGEKTRREMTEMSQKV